MGNLVEALTGVPKRIQLLQVSHFYKCDPAYGTGVAAGLGLDINEAMARHGGAVIHLPGGEQPQSLAADD